MALKTARYMLHKDLNFRQAVSQLRAVKSY